MEKAANATNDSKFSAVVLDKMPDESKSDTLLCSRKTMMDDEDDDAWMKDENNSSLDETESSDRVLPFGLNHSWPRVSSASSRNTSGFNHQPRKFLRQISQESLDESTSLLLGHVVILPDLPRDHVVESSVHFGFHPEMEGVMEADENVQGTVIPEDKIIESRPSRCEAGTPGRDCEDMEYDPDVNAMSSSMRIIKEENERVPEMKDRGPVCLHNTWVRDDTNPGALEESNDGCGKKNALHLHLDPSQYGSSEIVCSATEFQSDNLVSGMIANMMIQGEALSENVLSVTDSQTVNAVSDIIANDMIQDLIHEQDLHASADFVIPSTDLQNEGKNIVSDMIADVMIQDACSKDVCTATESQCRGENVVSEMIMNEMVQDETIGANLVSEMIANKMIQDQSVTVGENGGENVVSQRIANEMIKEQNMNTVGENLVSEMIANEIIREHGLNSSEAEGQNIVTEIIAKEMIEDQKLNLVKADEGNIISEMLANGMVLRGKSSDSVREGRNSEDASIVSKKKYLKSPSNERPPLHRHISRESIEESTSLLLDHVVVLDLDQQGGGTGTADKPGRSPFLMDIAENPLNHEANVAALEKEEYFLYKGEVDSSDSDEDVTDELKPNPSTVSDLLNASTGAQSIISEEAASTLKDIELIRVDLDDAIHTLQSLRDEFPDRTVDLPEDLDSGFNRVIDSLATLEQGICTNISNGCGPTSGICRTTDESCRTTTESCQTTDEHLCDIGDPACDTANDTSWFNQLPDEVILHVFHYLSHRELCRSVVLVCKKWHHLALDPTLWQHLDLSFNSNWCPPTDREELLQRCSLLQTLTLRGLDEVCTSEMETIIWHCPRIQELDLGFVSSFDDALFDVLASGCQTLTCLNVEGCDQVTDSLVSKLILLPRLRTLRLSHCTKLTDEAVCEIARFCHYLEELDIDGIPWVTDSAVLTLVKERMSTLQCLKLDGAELTDIAIKYILQCPDLEELNVSFCEQFTDKTLERLQDWKKPLHLRLQKGKEFSEAGLVNLFNSPAMCQLTSLNLSECSELKDQAVINIAHRCPLLTHLAMEWCWFVTDVGLVQVVHNCRHLENFDLIGLHAILGHWLADIPTKLPRLQFLDLRQCNSISDSMLVQLVLKKHDLLVMNYYGEEVKHDDIPPTIAM